jgi:hypothetical protein
MHPEFVGTILSQECMAGCSAGAYLRCPWVLCYLAGGRGLALWFGDCLYMRQWRLDLVAPSVSDVVSRAMEEHEELW